MPWAARRETVSNEAGREQILHQREGRGGREGKGQDRGPGVGEGLVKRDAKQLWNQKHEPIS